jgi:hypothetical protein
MESVEVRFEDQLKAVLEWIILRMKALGKA